MKHGRSPSWPFAAGLLHCAAFSSSVVVSAQTTDLGVGLITRTPVEESARISLDLAEIRENLSQGDFNTALIVYEEGKNSVRRDPTGLELPGKRSLQAMATVASEPGGLFDDDPTFLFHAFGLNRADPDGYRSEYPYANNFVMTALQDETAGTLAYDAAVALNLWMYATHDLWDAVRDCERSSDAGTNLDALGAAKDAGNAHALDEAMAFWIGWGQSPGGDGSGAEGGGDALYALAQRAGKLFGRNANAGGEAAANTELKALYEEARTALSFANACRPGSDAASSLVSVANRMVSKMTVPLIQMLIHSMKEGDAARVRLYSLAAVPQMSMCRSSTFRSLRELLLDRPYDGAKFVEALTGLQSMYDCLGITCEDIGAYKVDKIGQCASRPENYPMAEYSPTSYVHQQSKIDLDILQIKYLLSLEAYTPARHIYVHGKNSAKYRKSDDDPYEVRSLQEMARSSLRRKALPFYNDFVEYHDDPNYADTAVTDALLATGKWGSGSPEQRAEIVRKTLQYQVVYMYVLAEMADALSSCSERRANDDEDRRGAANAWDEVAAFYIGSLEGHLRGGSPDFDDGQLLWNLANKRCFEFGTQNSQGYANVNAEMEDLLYAGKGQLDAYDCAGLRRTVRRIEHLVLVPVIQSTLRYAIKNENRGGKVGHKDLAEGEAFALSILPVVASYDEGAAEIIERNMVVEPGIDPVKDGAQVVANAFFRIMDEFGLDCRYVGRAGDVDSCELYAPPTVADSSGGRAVVLRATRNPLPGASSSSLLLATALAAAAWL